MANVVKEVVEEVVATAIDAAIENNQVKEVVAAAIDTAVENSQVEKVQQAETAGNQPEEAEDEAATIEGTEETTGEQAITTEGNEEATGERTSVFFGNLPWSTSWQDLKDHIKEAGFEPGYVDVIRDKKTRLSKGFGLANFSSSKEAMDCIAKLNNSEITGRAIYVKLDRPPPAKRRPGAGFSKKTQPTKTTAKVGKPKAPKATSDRVFVGNLAWSVNWSALVKHMKQAGEVVYAEILTGVRDRSMGCALVAYKSKEEAQEALKTLSETEIEGRKIYVREDRESYWTVFVNNIPEHMTWQKLKDLCNQYGKVARSDRNSKGYGTVRFETEEDAKACIDGLNEKEYEGCTLQAMFANEAGEYQRAAEERVHDKEVEVRVDEEAHEEEEEDDEHDNKKVAEE